MTYIHLQTFTHNGQGSQAILLYSLSNCCNESVDLLRLHSMFVLYILKFETHTHTHTTRSQALCHAMAIQGCKGQYPCLLKSSKLYRKLHETNNYNAIY